MTDLHNQRAVAAHLATIASATQMLRAAGVNVLAHVLGNGVPVLVVSRPPAGITGTVRRRLPLADGRHDLTYRAPFEGVCIEWRTLVRPAPRVDLATLEMMGHA